MTRKILNILAISSILTSIAFILDGDPLEPDMQMRFTEFFGMMGIVFVFVSFFYFGSASMIKKFRKQRVN